MKSTFNIFINTNKNFWTISRNICKKSLSSKFFLIFIELNHNEYPSHDWFLLDPINRAISITLFVLSRPFAIVFWTTFTLPDSTTSFSWILDFSIVTSFWKPLTRSVSSHHSSIVQISRQNSSMTCFILLVHLIRAMKRSWESASDGSLRRRLNIERLFEEDNADRLGDRSEQKVHRLIRVVEREVFCSSAVSKSIYTWLEKMF